MGRLRIFGATLTARGERVLITAGCTAGFLVGMFAPWHLLPWGVPLP